ncbi:Alpha/Beta hydrolase protein [Collybia nuda]|uniref:Carboxylic ester hydrolase n=1 Tax=Collybia nuda TaxID=64659 RepID=A0A9P5Y3L5_9AGAR|nr:Alpha/Beta hydrolase protein [Collybia nuda]
MLPVCVVTFVLNALMGVLGITTPPTVNIKNGTVVGLNLPQFKQHAFLGIPYAQPPTGCLRLSRPRSVKITFKRFDATKYSPLCWNAPTTDPQRPSDGAGIPQSEDCLTINVVRPDNIAASHSLLPVMFWIHGGGLIEGGSGIDWHNGSYLVQAGMNFKNPIIFVSINYRLSQLGFLAGKALAEEGNLNLGHYDQRLALYWVQENIAAFGGDPAKVTIFGESSGAYSVGMHFRAFGGRDDNLFRAGIAQSGSADNYPLPDSPNLQSSYDRLVANSSCRAFITAETQLACLRQIPVDEFRFAVQDWATSAVVDGDIIPLSTGNALNAYRKGLFVKKPFMTGANTDEGAGLVGNPNSMAQFMKTLDLLGLDDATLRRLLELYPNEPYLGVPYNTGAFLPFGPESFYKQVSSIFGDAVFIALRRFVAEQLASQKVPVRSYRFNQIAINSTDAAGVVHFSEVAYVFGNPTCPMQHDICLSPRAGDRALSNLMQSMWISFAVHLDPNMNNFPGAPIWPDYSENAENMRFQNGGSSTEKDNFRQEGIQFLIDNLFPTLGGM